MTILDQIGWLPFRNDSTETVPPFSLLRVTGTATVNGQQLLTINKPNTTFQRMYGVNGQYAVGSGNYGKCTFGPRVILAYDTSGTPATFEGWGAKPSEWDAFPNRQGFSVLGTISEAESGLNIMWAMQEPIRMIRAQPISNISAGASGNADVRFNDADSEFDVSVQNKFADNGEQLSADKDAVFGWFEDEGVWSLLERDCE